MWPLSRSSDSLRSLIAGVVLIALTALAPACSHLPKSETKHRLQPRVPVALIVTREIKGELLGLPLAQPCGLAAGRQGTVFVVDAGNNRLLKLDSALSPVGEAGGRGAAAGLLSRPSFAVVDNDLNVLVSDPGNRRIARFDANLNYVDEIEFSDEDDLSKFGYPAGLAVTEFGDTWVADEDRDRVAVFNHTGQFDRFVGDFGTSGGQLSNPTDMVLTPEGDIAVCDRGNACLAIFDSYGSPMERVSLDGLSAPVALAASGDGFWVVDRDQAVVQLCNDSGRPLFSAGPLLTGSSQAMRGPTEVLLLTGDRLLIADTANNRLLLCQAVY